MSALEDGVSQSRVVPPARTDTRIRRRSVKYCSTAVVSFVVVTGMTIFYAIIERDYIPGQEPCHPVAGDMMTVRTDKKGGLRLQWHPL